MKLNVHSRPKQSENANKHGNSDLNNGPNNTSLSKNKEIEYFLSGPSKGGDKKTSTEITKQLQKELEDVFTGITSNRMRNHHISQHSCVSLAGTDTKDCYLEQPPHETCFSARSTRYSKCISHCR